MLDVGMENGSTSTARASTSTPARMAAPRSRCPRTRATSGPGQGRRGGLAGGQLLEQAERLPQRRREDEPLPDTGSRQLTGGDALVGADHHEVAATGREEALRRREDREAARRH